MSTTPARPREAAAALVGLVAAAVLALALILALIMGSIWGFKSFNRSQKIADANNIVTTSRIAANNQVELNRIRIDQQAQRVKIAEQEAEVRLREAQGVRAAQDEIAKTLTPQYIQYEMNRTLGEIAKSGKNSTVIYIPVGPDGLPVVAGANGKTGAAR